MSKPNDDQLEQPEAGAVPPAPETSGASSAPASGKPKRPRSEKQKAQFAAAAAKRHAKRQEEKARQAGVDTTGSAGPTPLLERAGAPTVETTPHQQPPASPEQLKRRQEGKATPDTSDVDPPEPQAPAPKPSVARSGLLGLLADGLGL